MVYLLCVCPCASAIIQCGFKRRLPVSVSEANDQNFNFNLIQDYFKYIVLDLTFVLTYREIGHEGELLGSSKSCERLNWLVLKCLNEFYFGHSKCDLFHITFSKLL